MGRSLGERVQKKLLKRLAFPILNRFLSASGRHLYHYAPESDRLISITDFGSDTYRYLRTGEIDADRWWPAVRDLGIDGGTILDVGANTGYVTAWLSALADRVYAFEPHPDNVRLLEEHLRIRRISNVEIRETAVGEREDPVTLYCKRRSGHHSLADIGGASLGSIRVPCTTVDSFLRREGVREVRLLKIDVEGFEPEVLRGARDALSSGRIQRVLFEFSPVFYRARGVDVRSPIDYLTGLGFDLFFTDGEIFVADDERAAEQCDVLAVGPSVQD